MSYLDIIENMFGSIIARVIILVSIVCWFGPVSFEVIFYMYSATEEAFIQSTEITGFVKRVCCSILSCQMTRYDLWLLSQIALVVMLLMKQIKTNDSFSC